MHHTNETTVAHIAELLHQTRSTTWCTDRALELSAAMRNQPSEVLAMALISYSAGLLGASRQVVALQLDCAKSQAARDAGELQ
jgi:hypothetical protein